MVAAERPNRFTIMARIQDEDLYMTPSPSVVSNPDPNLPELTFGLSDSSSDDDNELEDAVKNIISHLEDDTIGNISDQTDDESALNSSLNSMNLNNSPPQRTDYLTDRLPSDLPGDSDETDAVDSSLNSHNLPEDPPQRTLRVRQKKSDEIDLKEVKAAVHDVVKRFGKLPTIAVIKYLRRKNKDFDANMELYLKIEPNGMTAIRKKFSDLEKCSEEWVIEGFTPEMTIAFNEQGEIQVPCASSNHLDPQYFKSCFSPLDHVSQDDIDVLIKIDPEFRSNFYLWCSSKKKKNNLVRDFNIFFKKASFPKHQKEILKRNWSSFSDKVNKESIAKSIELSAPFKAAYNKLLKHHENEETANDALRYIITKQKT